MDTLIMTEKIIDKPTIEKIIIGKSDKFTTIKVSEATKERLDNIKLFRRETYDEVVIRMMNLINKFKDDLEEGKKELMKYDILRAVN